ncbi:MAG: hypothetical protein EXR75_11185 [Myxococcales bacterium]|nr:hypothetical protein [Myxococcales bacterium]
MMAEADLVSEGAVIDDKGCLIYCGTTSFSFAIEQDAADPRDARSPDKVLTLAALLAADPMARLYAVRAARREAASRAGGSLDVAYTDLRTSTRLEGGVVRMRIDIDVHAELVRLYDRIERA